MNLSGFRDLAEEWEREVETFRTRGMEREARMGQSYVEDLRDQIQEAKLELLTLEQAARETGLAYDTVQRKVSTGEWPNAGEKGSPRVRRCDIVPGLEPPKPRATSDPVESLAEDVLRARSGGG